MSAKAAFHFPSIVSIYGIAKYELDKNCNCIFKEIRVLSMKANNNSPIFSFMLL